MTKEKEIKDQQYKAECKRELLRKENDEIKYKMEWCRKAMESGRQSLQQSECLYKAQNMNVKKR